MKTIHKFPLMMVLRQDIKVEPAAAILSAQFQGDQLCLWVGLDTDTAPVSRCIEIFPTGVAVGDLPPGIFRRYIGTAQHVQNGTVWHVFEIEDRRP